MPYTPYAITIINNTPAVMKAMMFFDEKFKAPGFSIEIIFIVLDIIVLSTSSYYDHIEKSVGNAKSCTARPTTRYFRLLVFPYISTSISKEFLEIIIAIFPFCLIPFVALSFFRYVLF